jgi:hypothetical protein
MVPFFAVLRGSAYPARATAKRILRNGAAAFGRPVRRPAKGSSAIARKTNAFCASILRGVLNVKNPLDSIWGTVISGFILTAILYFIARWIVSSATGAGA